jgi:hypothetical protein
LRQALSYEDLFLEMLYDQECAMRIFDRIYEHEVIKALSYEDFFFAQVI